MASYGRLVVANELDKLGIAIGPENASGWAAALCPLHSDSSPSFTIKVSEGAWKCRSGCGASGDLADLVARITQEPRAAAQARLRNGLFSMGGNPLRAAWLVDDADELDRANEPEPLWYDRHHIPKYWMQRGFTIETGALWQIGYDQELPALVIPVFWRGSLTGLIRRRIGEGTPRYLYSWGMPKDEILFGLDHVSEKQTKVVLVEGSLDCIWLHQCGYPALALLGSSLSAAQIDTIKRRFAKVVLAFDNDDAGRKATEQAQRMLRGLDLTFLQLPDGVKDVQECDKSLLNSLFTTARQRWYSAVASPDRIRKFYVDPGSHFSELASTLSPFGAGVDDANAAAPGGHLT